MPQIGRMFVLFINIFPAFQYQFYRQKQTPTFQLPIWLMTFSSVAGSKSVFFYNKASITFRLVFLLNGKVLKEIRWISPILMTSNKKDLSPGLKVSRFGFYLGSGRFFWMARKHQVMNVSCPLL